MDSSLPRGDRLRRPAQVLLALLGLTIISDLAALVVEIELSSVLDRLAAGEDVSFATVDAADNRSLVASLVQVGVYVLAVIAFIVWFHRARGELDAINAPGQRYTRGWTIGAWFIPFFNLVRPKKMINDVWRGSGEPDAGDERVPALVHWWWGVWIVAWLVGNVAGQSYLEAETLSEQQDASSMAIFSNVVWIISAVLALLCVRAISARVRARAALGPQDPPSAWTPTLPREFRLAPEAVR